MKLQDWIGMYEADGFHLREARRQEVGDFVYILMLLSSDNRTEQYGRHGDFVLKVAKKDKEIEEWDDFNLTGGWSEVTPLTQEVESWFERHVGT